MSNDSRDRGHADQSAVNSVRRHGIVVVAIVGLAFVACLANFALGHAGAGVAAAIAGLLAFGAGLSWLGMEGRRVRQAEPYNRAWR